MKRMALCVVALGVPQSIWFVACAILEHSVADPSNVARYGVPCIVFGYSVGDEMILILAKRILSHQGNNGRLL